MTFAVQFGQIYVQPGVSFPFSAGFQRRLSREVTELVEPSPKFIKKYGSDFTLIFRISAKQGLEDNEIYGPAVFRKDKDVEYSVFLPFDVIATHSDAPRYALRFLLKGVCKVFESLEIKTDKLLDKQDTLIEGICLDQSMVRDKSLRPTSNQARIWDIFQAFFDPSSRA